jgi:hypothetical protein
VLIDFSPLNNPELKLLEFSRQFTPADLRAATNASLDTILSIIADLNDAQVVFIPHDPDANDPHAVAGEEHIGWSIAHLVAHVTATSEESAAYSSVLARGIVYPREPRLRYETPWRTIVTRQQTLARLEESRRMRLAFIDAWPDEPHLDVLRELPPQALERLGQLNAPANFLSGLRHEQGHFDQFREVARQAREAVQVQAGN